VHVARRRCIDQSRGVKKKESKADDTQIDTKLGKLKTRYIPRTLLDIAGRTIEDRFWLSEDVPFGWAKYEFTVKGRGEIIEIDRWEVSQTGKGAKSEVNESIADSQRPAYLYSLPADGTWVEFDVKYEQFLFASIRSTGKLAAFRIHKFLRRRRGLEVQAPQAQDRPRRCAAPRRDLPTLPQAAPPAWPRSKFSTPAPYS
jgi:hypothetical protein